jgi:hypothetical protein
MDGLWSAPIGSAYIPALRDLHLSNALALTAGSAGGQMDRSTSLHCAGPSNHDRVGSS